MVLSDPQKRTLMYMDQRGPRWFPLAEIEARDVVFSLIDHGLVWYLAAMNAVALTASGTELADALRSAVTKQD